MSRWQSIGGYKLVKVTLTDILGVLMSLLYGMAREFWSWPLAVRLGFGALFLACVVLRGCRQGGHRQDLRRTVR